MRLLHGTLVLTDVPIALSMNPAILTTTNEQEAGTMMVTWMFRTIVMLALAMGVANRGVYLSMGLASSTLDLGQQLAQLFG